MTAKNFASPALVKSLTAGVGDAPLGRVNPSSSVGDQVLRFNDIAGLLLGRV